MLLQAGRLLATDMLQAGDIILIVVVVIGAILAGLYFLNKWVSRKYTEQQSIISKTKMQTTIYVIDKKKDKLVNANIPKAAKEQIPKFYKFMKMPLVKAKIGPQIITLMCDKKVYDALPLKKNVSVELSGIYIVSMKGMKTEKEMKAAAKQKKAKAKAEKKNEKTKNKK